MTNTTALAHAVDDKVEAAYRRADFFGETAEINGRVGPVGRRPASDVVVLERRRG